MVGINSWEMMVTDLHRFLDLPTDTPGPARRLAEHLRCPGGRAKGGHVRGSRGSRAARMGPTERTHSPMCGWERGYWVL